VPHRCKSRA